MKKCIVQFVKQACEKYGMTAYYIPDGDTYVLLKKGKAVQNFNTEQYFSIPEKIRMRDYRPLIAGLNHNLGEGNVKNQLVMPRKLGIKIA